MFDDLDLEGSDQSPTIRYRFHERAFGPPRKRPPALNKQDIVDLDEGNRDRYNRARETWHSDITVNSRQMQSLHDTLDLVVRSNGENPGRVRPSALVDSSRAGVGKTTAMTSYAAAYWRREVKALGSETPNGARVPVAYVTLSAGTTPKSLLTMLAEFYDAPTRRLNASDLGRLVSSCVRNCRTRLIVLDDVHFLKTSQTDIRDVANQLKWLSTEVPATFVYVGIDLEDVILREGLPVEAAATSQIARRTTTLALEPFPMRTRDDSHEWRRLLRDIQRDLVLASLPKGRLSTDLWRYMYERTSGNFSSLMTLIKRGCELAMSGGNETLDAQLLELIPLDKEAEEARPLTARLLDELRFT
ncbi:MAG TPA: AAA family ATPase [Acidimicrobiales bacterium]|nr:AAA family ATPase [Acidimicrobiales bacterium]